MTLIRSAFFLTSLSVFPVLLAAQKLTLTTGLVEDQVLQREDSDHAAVNLSGTAANLNNRLVEIRALGRHGVLSGLDWAATGKVAANKWSAKITLPTGGPYRVELRSGGPTGATETVSNVFVGDLWVLAGQSNMEGVGNLVDVESPNGLVHSFDQADKWVLAEEPLHSLPDAADKVHWRKNQQGELERLEGQKQLDFIAGRKKGAGLGLSFAVEMVKRTGVPIGLVPCAHGGTSMDQWNPELRGKGGESLYGATLRRVKLLGGKVKGVLWYQGESEANPKAVPEFQAKFEKLVTAFRTDFGQPDLPFYYVQIGRYINNSNPNDWNAVQEIQRKSEKAIKAAGMVPSVDLSLDDLIHVGTADLKRLGRRLAILACIDLFKTSVAGLTRGPRPQSANLEGTTLRVTFSEVNGRLTTQGRIAGFSIHDPKGEEIPAIFKAEMDPASPNAVLLHLIGKLPEGATLRYGAGKNPYCNLRDQADMAAPVFGPMPIQR